MSRAVCPFGQDYVHSEQLTVSGQPNSWRKSALKLGECPFEIGDRVVTDPVITRRTGLVVDRMLSTITSGGRYAIWDVGFIGYDGWLVKIKDEVTGEESGWINVLWLSELPKPIEVKDEVRGA